MITIEEYKNNPCKLSSIPYWKLKSINLPNNIRVIHDEEFTNDINTSEKDTMYFRLLHNHINIEEAMLPDYYSYKEVNTESIEELLSVVDIINASYEDINVNLTQVKS